MGPAPPVKSDLAIRLSEVRREVYPWLLKNTCPQKFPLD
jgi:hypothetical protein